jgi:RNA-directed DNA polymerase
VNHEKLLTLVGKQIADSRVLKLIQQMLEAGYEERGQKFATPQGGVVSPLLSNILLTPFDKEMRRQGYQLTLDWVVTCRTRAEAEHALARAVRILEQLGVTLNQAKTRIVHITRGFEFLGFKIQRGKGSSAYKSKLNRQNLYAIPTQKSVDRCKDQIRALTRRRIPLRLSEVIETINPIIRGWGNYYCRSHVRKRFHQLHGRIIRRLWSHRTKRWRNRSVERISHQTVAHGVQAGQPRLAHTLSSNRESPFVKAGYGKTVRSVCVADRGKLFIERLVRLDRGCNSG